MKFEIISKSVRRKALITALMKSYNEQLNLEKHKCLAYIILHEKMNGEDAGFIYFNHYTNGRIIIELNSKLADRDLARSLAHEMVHAKQHIKGQAVDANTGTYWCGKLYPLDTNYLDAPWEQEAFKREELLSIRALNSKYLKHVDKRL